MIRLFFEDGGEKKSVEYSSGDIFAGRGADCEIALRTNSVSRRHFRIFTEGPFVYIEDLNSTNGTFVNGVRVASKVALSHGDEIKAGECALKFFDDEGEILDGMADKLANGFFSMTCEVRTDDAFGALVDSASGLDLLASKVEKLNLKIPDTTPGTRTLKQALSNILADIDSIKGRMDLVLNSRSKQGDPQPAGKPEKSDRAKDYAKVLDDVKNIVSTVEDHKKACGFILSVVMKVLGTNRGFIVIKDPMIGSIVPLASKIGTAEFADSAPSMMVARYVLNNLEPVLVGDPMLDERFMGMSESIVSGVIKSVICVPLITNSICVGALYLDSTEEKKDFSEIDRDFVLKLADHVCGLLEKTGLFGDLLAEYGDVKTRETAIGFYIEELDSLSDKLVAGGIIRPEEIERIRENIRTSAKSPLRCILDEKYCDDPAIEKFLEEFRIKRDTASGADNPGAVLKSIPRDFAYSRCLVPAGQGSAGELRLFMQDPLDRYSAAEVEKMARCRVRAYFADRDTILSLIGSLYRNIRTEV